MKGMSHGNLSTPSCGGVACESSEGVTSVKVEVGDIDGDGGVTLDTVQGGLV